ncbi:heterokaryon incompatibility protein-domain-containing protein [Ganoderma leucocontextum]|nr:heterokaryon incompatibility protein-domain-containing protein [Ganoderma leucocontextum]
MSNYVPRYKRNIDKIHPIRRYPPPFLQPLPRRNPLPSALPHQYHRLLVSSVANAPMWLLDTEKIHLQWFPNPTDVSYAILSHVWAPDEQTFQDTPRVHPSRSRSVLHRARDRIFRPPSHKIRNACAKARHDGFRWLWVDTCCIDKSNSTELSEAINSMYAWYQGAAMCYALLDDVPNLKEEDPRKPASSFRRSKWYKRGWTLQELIAPRAVIFLSKSWEAIGAKRILADLIQDVTGIDQQVLTHRRKLEDVSIACRMSWAAGRETTRIEDQAYCLMGIFGVYMSTIYGEGRHAFVRLQEEIIKKSSDQTIFAWGSILDNYHSGPFVTTAKEHDYEPQSEVETLFASSPADFAGCADIRPIPQWRFAERIRITETFPEYTKSSVGVRTTFPLVNIAHQPPVDAALALLACEDGKGQIIALYLRSHGRSTATNKYYVGGYIAQGERCIQYYRATRLPVSSTGNLAPIGEIRPPSGRHLRIAVRPMLREVHVHSHNPAVGRSITRNTTTSSPSSPRSSMVFFEPPCSIVLSKRSVERLRDMGYVLPNIPSDGFRLDLPGDYRTISFLGFESSTVHIGVCPLDHTSSTQTAQLWATVRFDVEVNTLLEECISKASSGPSKEADLPERGRDINPDESMLVQSWKNARCTIGSKGRQVRLTFSYPRALDGIPDPGQKVADLYELDIRFEGYYRQQGGNAVRRKSTISTSTAMSGSRPAGRHVARRTFSLS